ncbi:VOC family protein [Spirosoma validum]|uniref:VOC family protein n=1 Tax=Spirosoma validum TaxID=2771355 RepID=A0A927GF57_9BACT|nr:VOC family protein [Spirosoma validum]MBD2755378.1 VOC family protein [Spirosoma validum]
MKLNAGIITTKLAETKAFYCNVLNFGVTFENDFYLLLHTPNQQAELAFLLPNHPSQQPLFQPEFDGKGLFLTIELPNVDEEHDRLQQLDVPIAINLRDEPWGDRHFAILDPNGIGIDFVTYKSND